MASAISGCKRPMVAVVLGALLTLTTLTGVMSQGASAIEPEVIDAADVVAQPLAEPGLDPNLEGDRWIQLLLRFDLEDGVELNSLDRYRFRLYVTRDDVFVPITETMSLSQSLTASWFSNDMGPASHTKFLPGVTWGETLFPGDKLYVRAELTNNSEDKYEYIDIIHYASEESVLDGYVHVWTLSSGTPPIGNLVWDNDSLWIEGKPYINGDRHASSKTFIVSAKKAEEKPEIPPEDPEEPEEPEEEVVVPNTGSGITGIKADYTWIPSAIGVALVMTYVVKKELDKTSH